MVDFSTHRTCSSHALRAVALAIALTPLSVSGASAASPVALGTADSFALLAGSTITNTGPTTISGDIGLCCSGTATPGFGSVSQPSGAQYIGTGSPAAIAQDDLDTAYASAAGQAVEFTVPTDLSLTGTPANPLRPGVYEATAHGAFQINTGLTLDFQGDPNAVFVFQGTSVTTAAGAGGSVTIVNAGGAPSTCNIVWQLSDATQGVTLGTSSAFKGTTLALGASVLGTSATVEGRILTRRSKAVTLDSNTITRTACAIPAAGGGGGGDAGATPPPAAGPGAGSGAPTTSPDATPPPAAPAGAHAPTSTRPVVALLPGLAGISGPSGPVTGPFTIAVTGRDIVSVTFSIDGRPVRTVRTKAGRKRFVLKVDPRRQSRRVHRVTARVTFGPRTRIRRTTVRFVYRRPSITPRSPRYTG